MLGLVCSFVFDLGFVLYLLDWLLWWFGLWVGIMFDVGI